MGFPSYQIPFNNPYMTGNELRYIQEAASKGKLSGNGEFTKCCQEFFENKFGFKKCFLTNSGTAALEMAAILLDIQPGDEVIMPSFTFVSTANAFVLRGAKVVFVDSHEEQPNIDETLIEKAITPKTKAIVVVHYAGYPCNMDYIMELAEAYGLKVVEDAAHAIGSFYKERPLGSLGHLSAFSFHETKNIHSGEGGLLAVNDLQFANRAEVIWEKGTNRQAFFRGEVDKYSWVDIGSSFLPSEITAAFLWAQLERLEEIQKRRHLIWEDYYSYFTNTEKNDFVLKSSYLKLFPRDLNEFLHTCISKGIEFNSNMVPNEIFEKPKPEFSPNGHMFYLVLASENIRSKYIEVMKAEQVQCVFHYQSLHQSSYYLGLSGSNSSFLPNSEKFSKTLLRLPLYYELA